MPVEESGATPPNQIAACNDESLPFPESTGTHSSDGPATKELNGKE